MSYIRHCMHGRTAPAVLQSRHGPTDPCRRAAAPSRVRRGPAFSPLYRQIKDAADAQPAGAASGSPARPSRARSSWRRASRSARARCARPSTNWRPRTCWCAARARAPSSPPMPRSSTQYRFLRLTPDDGARPRMQRRLLDCRRLRAPADVARRSAEGGDAAVQVRRLLLAGDAAGGAGRHLAARRAVQGPDGRAAGRPDKGPMYGLFEAEFGVRMIRAEEKIRAVAADAEAGRRCWRWPPGAPLLSVERLSFTYGDRPVELRRGLYHTDRAPLPQRAELSARRPQVSVRLLRCNKLTRFQPGLHERNTTDARDGKSQDPAPMHLIDAVQYRLPLAGVVSILHRASGAVDVRAAAVRHLDVRHQRHVRDLLRDASPAPSWPASASCRAGSSSWSCWR